MDVRRGWFCEKVTGKIMEYGAHRMHNGFSGQGNSGASPTSIIRTADAAQFIDEARARLPQMEFSPASGIFRAELDTRVAGDAMAGYISSSPTLVHWSNRAASTTTNDHVFKLVWQVDGVGEMEQDRQHVRLDPGALALYRLSRPYELQTSGNYRVFVLWFDLSETLQWRQLADRYSGQALPMDSATHAALAAIRSLFAMPRDESSETVMRCAMELVFRSLQRLAHHDACVVVPMPSLRLEQVRKAAIAGLADPDFSPDALARLLKISRRSLYAEFQHHGMSTPAAFIRNLRLELCYAALVNPELGHCSVTDIAFENGFSDSTSFSRAFRQRYDIAPSQLRKHLAGRFAD